MAERDGTHGSVAAPLRLTPLRRAWLREMGIERVWRAEPAVAQQNPEPQEALPVAPAAARSSAAPMAPPATAPSVPAPAIPEPDHRDTRSAARAAVEMARKAAGLQQRAGARPVAGAESPVRATTAGTPAVPVTARAGHSGVAQAAAVSEPASRMASAPPVVQPQRAAASAAEPPMASAPSAGSLPGAVQAEAPSAPSVSFTDAPQQVETAESPVIAPSTDASAWDTLQGEVMGCVACGLCEGRTQPVFGVGPRHARWMVVGEAPGEQEDRQGDPFVGRSGQLLDSMLASIGLSRQRDVFIANVIKCRPPGNRNPRPEEVATCSPYLMRQMALLKPERILLLGSFAAQTLLNTQASVGSLRGKVHTLAVEGRQVPVVVSYHPAYLLRSPHEKARAWQDLRMAVSAQD